MPAECSVCGYAVEWVRACKVSSWKLLKGSNRTRKGFYYFAAKDTPFYPGGHSLWSRDWVSDEITGDEPFGEAMGRTTFHDGRPPSALPIPVRTGSADCIENGERPDLPRQTGRSAFCGRILPDDCYGPRDPLEDATNVYDCGWGYEAVNIVNELYTSLAAGIAAAEAFFDDDAVITGYERGQFQTPRHIVVIVRQNCFVFCEGTTMAAQWASQILGASFGCPRQGIYGTLGIWERSARRVVNSVGQAGGGDCSRFQFIGHSLGGAVMCVSAAKVSWLAPERKVELLTYGCPKPGDADLVDMIAGLRQQHWVNFGDPVPYVPPKNADLFAVFTALGLLWSSPANPFQRPRSITTLTRDFQMVQGLTEEISPELVANVVEFAAAGGASWSGSEHLTPEYIFRLGNACPCVEPKPDAIAYSKDGVKLGEGLYAAPILGTYAVDGVKISDGVAALVVVPTWDPPPPAGKSIDGVKLGEGWTNPYFGDYGVDGVKLIDGVDGVKLITSDEDGVKLGDETASPLQVADEDGLRIGDEDASPIQVADEDGLRIGDEDASPIQVADEDGLRIGDEDGLPPVMTDCCGAGTAQLLTFRLHLFWGFSADEIVAIPLTYNALTGTWSGEVASGGDTLGVENFRCVGPVGDTYRWEGTVTNNGVPIVSGNFWLGGPIGTECVPTLATLERSAGSSSDWEWAGRPSEGATVQFSMV